MHGGRVMKHALTDIPGIGDSTAAILAEHGINSVKSLIKSGAKGLIQIPGFGEKRATTIFEAASGLKNGKPKKNKDSKKKAKKKKNS